jgi:hypothetical protein
LDKFNSNVRPVHPIIVFDDNNNDGIFETREYTPNYRKNKDGDNTSYTKNRTYSWDELINKEEVKIRGGSHKKSRYFDDNILKQAISNIEILGLFTNDSYHYWNNNCQDYISNIIKEYDRIIIEKRGTN